MPVSPGRAGVKQEMQKFKGGQLHSRSPKGPVVTNPKQAIAISLHEAGLSKPKPKKKAAPAFTPKVKTPDAGGMY